MEHDHHVVFGRLLKKRFVKINQLPGLMIEEINLRACHAEVVQHLEELFARFGSAKLFAMFPEPDTYAQLARVSHNLFSPLGCPFAPKFLENAVVESQFRGHPREFLHALDALQTIVEVAPHCASGLNP